MIRITNFTFELLFLEHFFRVKTFSKHADHNVGDFCGVGGQACLLFHIGMLFASFRQSVCYLRIPPLFVSSTKITRRGKKKAGRIQTTVHKRQSKIPTALPACKPAGESLIFFMQSIPHWMLIEIPKSSRKEI